MMSICDRLVNSAQCEDKDVSSLWIYPTGIAPFCYVCVRLCAKVLHSIVSSPQQLAPSLQWIEPKRALDLSVQS